MVIVRPMLASTVKNVDSLRFPLIASPKLDGIRFVKCGGRGLAKSFKPIKNNFVRSTLERLCPDGIDGELMSGDSFQGCTSAVMSEDGEPAFTLWAFDLVVDDTKTPYCDRLKDLVAVVDRINDPRVKFVPVETVNSREELDLFEKKTLSSGFEGVMLRDPRGPYKCGRATEREGWLMKLKRFVDSEAVIVGFEEQYHNDNKAMVNELGYTARSSAKAGKNPAGTLGKFVVRDEKNFPGVDFCIGTGEGLTAALRLEIWNNKSAYLGKIVTYRYQDVSVKDAPRLPIWHGFRDPDDM